MFFGNLGSYVVLHGNGIARYYDASERGIKCVRLEHKSPVDLDDRVD